MKYLCLLLISLPAFGQFGAASRILSGTGAPVAAQCTVENNVGLVWARKDGADVGTTFYVCGATGVGTYGWELRGGAPGGASALTTVGSVPFVTASGVLGQSANFRFFSGTGNLVVGTTTDDGTNRLQVAGGARFATTANGTPAFVSLSATGTGSDAAVDTVGSGAYINLRSTLAGPYAGTQINRSTNTVLWFTGTQGLDSYGWFTGSSFTRLASLTTGGTLTLYNETPTTGSTSLVVRAGAGQSTTNLQTWQNNAGTALSYIGSDGAMRVSATFYAVLNSSGSLNEAVYGTDVQLASGRAFLFSATTDAAAAKDLAFRRFAAGRLELNSGTAIGTTPGNARDIMARGFYAAETTSDPSAADLTIAGSNAQDTFRLYMKNDKLVIAYQRSGTVNYLTIPLDGATTTFTQSTTAP